MGSSSPPSRSSAGPPARVAGAASPHVERLVRRARVGEALFALALLPLALAAAVVGTSGPVAFAEPRFAFVWIASGLGWLLAVLQARGGAGDLRTVVAGAVLLRVLVAAGDPRLSDDVHRYVWEGHLVARGTSPYAHAPSAPELAELRAELRGPYEAMNHPDVSAAYPPGTQAVLGAVAAGTRLAGAEPGTVEPALLRGLFTLCDLLVLVPLVALLRRRGLPTSLAVVWAWCPLVVVEFAGSGHFDALGVLLFVWGLERIDRHDGRRPERGAGSGASGPTGGGPAPRARRTSARLDPRAVVGYVLLALAVLVKWLPVCAVPFAARGRGAGRRLVLVALVVAAGFAPLLWMEGGVGGIAAGLGEYGLRWEWQSLVFRWVERPLVELGLARDGTWSDPRRVARVVVGLAWLGWGVRAWVRGHGPVRAAGSLVGAFLVLSPTLHPWYAAWMVPFVALRPAVSWCWLLAVLPVTYLPLLASRASGVIVEPAWLWPLVAGPFFLLQAYEARTRRGPEAR